MRNTLANARRTVQQCHKDEFVTRANDPRTFEEIYGSVRRLFPRPVWALMRVRAVAWIVGKICYLLQREQELERKLSASQDARRRDLFFGHVRETISAQRHCRLQHFLGEHDPRTYIDDDSNRYVIFYGELLRVILVGDGPDDAYNFELYPDGLFKDDTTEQRFNDLMRELRHDGQHATVKLTKSSENRDSGPGEPTA